MFLSGDWNLAPQTLEQTGWPDAVAGKVVAPESPTYVAGSASDVKDFFVVDQRLFDANAVVSCETRGSNVISKHKPVMLILEGKGRDCTIQAVRRHKSMPVNAMIGPRLFCAQPLDWDPIASRLQRARSAQELTDGYADFVRLFTLEILDATGLERSDDSYQTTRASPPVLVQERVFENETGFPRAGWEARIWRELYSKLVHALQLLQTGCARQAVLILKGCERFTPQKKPEKWSEWRRHGSKLARRLWNAPAALSGSHTGLAPAPRPAVWSVICRTSRRRTRCVLESTRSFTWSRC